MTKALIQELRPLIEAHNQLARKAEAGFAIQVDGIIQRKRKDTQQIEWLLSCMLDFCFDDSILALFKKLCRYYYAIDPAATASYVYMYRDMWDDNYTPEESYDVEEHTSNSDT